MAEDLVRREQAAEGLSEEARAKARLQAEIARMRAAAAKAAAAAAASKKHEGSRNPPPSSPSQQQQPEEQQQSPALNATLSRTLKVSWTRPGHEYTADELRTIFSVHGEVEDVVAREGKKRKGSALVVMGSEGGAKNAEQSVNGGTKDPLLVVLLGRINTRSDATNGTKAKESGGLPPIPMGREGGKEENRGAAASSRPLGPRPTKPLFPAGAGAGRNGSGGSERAKSAVGFASFSSFQSAPGVGERGGAAPPVRTTVEERQGQRAEERSRMAAQMMLEEEEEGEEY